MGKVLKSACLSASMHIQKVKNHFKISGHFLYMLPVAWSFSERQYYNTLCTSGFVMSCFHITEPMVQNQTLFPELDVQSLPGGGRTQTNVICGWVHQMAASVGLRCWLVFPCAHHSFSYPFNINHSAMSCWDVRCCNIQHHLPDYQLVYCQQFSKQFPSLSYFKINPYLWPPDLPPASLLSAQSHCHVQSNTCPHARCREPK